MATTRRLRDALLADARDNPRPAGAASQLADPGWRHVDKTSLDDFTAGDWALLDAQRAPYLAGERARQALEMLAAQKDAPSFGYQVNNYEHCLQAATMALKDGQDEETVVVSLFHDLGFVTNNETHGEFAAQFLRPYVSDRNVWMLERHMYFQTVHLPTYPGIDTGIRERWRGHEWFEWTAEWVRKYDVASIDAALDTAALTVFEPMVQRVFARPPREAPVPD
jgi:predicted HD phosphohydrolase